MSDPRQWILEGDPPRVHSGPAIYPGAGLRVVPLAEVDRLREALDGSEAARLATEQKSEARRAEVERLREALVTLVEASEEFFRPNSLGAPLWPATVKARDLLSADAGKADA